MAPLIIARACRVAVPLLVLTLTLLLLALLVLPAAAPASAGASATAVEVRLEELLNAERAERGISPLRTDVRLVASARDWSAQMASSGTLAHDPNLGSSVSSGASSWGENVAMTSSSDAAASIHANLMDSSSHRAIILDPDFTDLGLGVAVSGSETWAVQRFTAGAPARVSGAVEATAALAIELFGSGGAKRAVVVRDDVFPDSLAAGPLAGGSGPILFTPPGPVTYPQVRAALEQVLPRGSTIWIVGGSAAVSGGVESELSGAGWNVRRIAGPDRVTTAAAVAGEVADRDGSPSTVLLATAANWPDAASGGAYGAVSGAPILLAYPDELPAVTVQTLASLRPSKTVALGGEAALSDGVVSSAGASRLSGATRQGTSAAVAEELWGKTSASQADAWIASPADGDAWAWALGAAPMAARQGAPVLIAGDPLSDHLAGYLEGLGYSGSASASVTVHGPVPAGAVDDLRALLR